MRPSAWLSLLILLSVQASACADPDDDARALSAPLAADAGALDAALTDGGAADAGVAPWDPCGADAGLGALTPLCTHPEVSELREQAAPRTGTRAFTFRVVEPVDHRDPARGSFHLRVQLLHRDASAPTVLYSSGYWLFARTPTDNEISSLLSANVVSVEHRFFGASTPLRTPAAALPAEAFTHLTIAQAAADTHRVVALLKPLYRRAWISTGASKGGQVSVYHRRFYPDDVDGTVAYVAPHSYSTHDPRYDAFLAQVGDATCRAKVHALQRGLLVRRDALLPHVAELLRARGSTFARVGSLDTGFEHVAQELRFAFYQYGTAADCDTLPAPNAEPEALLRAVDEFVPLDLASDQSLGLDGFAGYYYQAATQMGQYGPLEEGLTDLLRYPGSYTVDRYAPVPGLRFDDAAMRDVQAWLLAHGDRFIFVYGERDPWTATAFETPRGRDVHTYLVPGGNHGAKLGDARLAPEARAEARAILARWAGVPLPPSALTPLPVSPQPLHRHLRPAP